MATGSLKLRVADLLDEPAGPLSIDFEPARDSPGGASMKVDFDSGGATEFVVTDLECRAGPGTLYLVRVDSPNFRTYGFFQMILEDRVNKASDNQIRLLANPKRVKDISAPAFGGLNSKLRDFLGAARTTAAENEDKDLEGLSGSALFDAMGPLRKACMLNLFAKAKHPSTLRSFAFLRELLLLRQDRCFCTVDPALEEFLPRQDRFKSAPNLLHKPLRGYELRASFKSRDDHANIQFTLMRNAATGEMAADVDIDEATGLEHGFEVIRNLATQGRTNPYLVRELLLLTDATERTLDPGYRLVFK